jgi:Na+/melibiose symporter-like transporter
VEAPAPSLWRNRAFLRLLFAGIVSNAGNQITGLALPLTAVVALDATSAEMGWLRGAGILPELLFALAAGVWVDRARRQAILVGADLGRALLLGSVPLAALFGGPTLPHLWLVAFAVGSLTVFSSLASVSILPALVPRSQLVEANSRLTVSGSVLTIAGPGVAGGLIQIVGAPKAIAADAASCVLSALSLRGLGTREAPPRRPFGGVWREIGEGMRELVRTPLLRSLTVSISVGAFGLGMQSTVQLLFLVDELGLTPALVGIAAACGGGGSLVGAALAGRASRRLGTGPTIVLGNALWAAGAVIVPLAGLGSGDMLVVAAGQAIASAGGSLWGVNQMSLRQAVTPVELFARATAARRIPMSGMQLAGAALAGALGGAIGLRATLLLGAVGLAAGCLLLLFSPVREVREI